MPIKRSFVPRQVPNTLVLHARAGNVVGDMASYDYFTLGGPYSVRGYSQGELGSCRCAAAVGGSCLCPAAFKNVHFCAICWPPPVWRLVRCAHRRLHLAAPPCCSTDVVTNPHSAQPFLLCYRPARRRFIEAAAEARLPLKNYKLPGTLYGFVEGGTDLGSSASVPGNPTEYYRKAGSGMSYGVGLKAFGACRFEYARDCNAGTGAVFVHWGERF